LAENSHGLTSEHAAAEMLRRQRARNSMAEYARSIDIPGAPASNDQDNEVFKPIESSIAPHHLVMMDAIQRTMEKKRGRLMIFAPPGSAKSTYVSVVASNWAMAKWPGHRIILASYGLELAERQSRKARALARDKRHQAIWPEKPTLSTEQKSVGDWSTSTGSNLMAAGFQSGITGNRANGLLIDDPVKNREEADSAAMREKTKSEFRESAKTRLTPNGYIILIQTRWHEDDLAGSILPEDYKGESGMIKCRDGQVWEILNIPAKAEHPDDPIGRKPGEYLWPEYIPVEHWQEFENDEQGKRTWSSLFQQRPSPDTGLLFQREMFRRYDPDIPRGQPGGMPDIMQVNGATDNATKEGGGDFTEHAIGGLDANGDLIFTDWWYGQKTTDVTIAACISLIQRHKPLHWAHEGGVIEHAIGPALNRAMREAKPNRVHVILEPLTSIKNKQIKLSTLQAWAAAGRVWLPIKREWADRLIDQLCGFPTARYDDAADAAGLLARLLDLMLAGELPSSKPKPQLVPFTAEWLEWSDTPERKIRYT
jgi:predicted phage terminase large subunit-like protein